MDHMEGASGAGAVHVLDASAASTTLAIVAFMQAVLALRQAPVMQMSDNAGIGLVCGAATGCSRATGERRPERVDR